MASKKVYVEHLKKLPLFQSCTQKELQLIAKAADEITMPAGSVVVLQGQAGREAFVVLDGSVTVRRNGKKLASLGEGSIFGELSLLDAGPRSATVVCDTDCTLLLLSHRSFMAVLDEVPEMSRKLMSALAARIRTLDRQYYG